MTQALQRDRLDYLDSLRGIAALAVVLSHCWFLNSDSFLAVHRSLDLSMASVPDMIYFVLERINQLACSAVIIFFVLSGFVLALSMQKNPISYVPYVVRRFFRIYPAFAVTILASYALHSLIGLPNTSGSEWLRTVNEVDLSARVLLKHLLLWGTNESRDLDGVAWTLVHEMRISIAFPLILLAIKRFNVFGFIGFLALSVACSLWSLHATGTTIVGWLQPNMRTSFFDTAFYMVFFAAGAWLALNRVQAVTLMARFPKWLLVVFAVTLACFMLKIDYDKKTLMGNVTDLLRGTAAIGLITAAMTFHKFSTVLHFSPLIWLGRISYSFYLVHLPVLYVITQTFGKTWDIVSISVSSILLSMLIAEMLARFVEFPMIAIGKKLCIRAGNRLQMSNVA